MLDDTYSAFLLATKDNKHKSFSRIGKVVEGYELIKGKHGQEITLTISDCGVILDIWAIIYVVYLESSFSVKIKFF